MGIRFKHEKEGTVTVHEIDAPAWRKAEGWVEVGPNTQVHKPMTPASLEPPVPTTGAFAESDQEPKKGPTRKPKED